MRKKIIFLSFFIGLIFISNSIGIPQTEKIAIDKIRLLPEDIPNGFMYGVIPDQYKSTLKNNPWELDGAAIQKLTDKIYPGGDFKQISGIHVTIIARRETPHGDDIVCYIIQYKNNSAARNEIKKISEYVDYNLDRSILHVKNNIAVFLFVDNISDFHLLKELNKKIIERIEKG